MIIITENFSVFNVPSLLYDLQDGITHSQTGAPVFGHRLIDEILTLLSAADIPTHHPAERHFGCQLERRN
jgi:hypothetical protein